MTLNGVPNYRILQHETVWLDASRYQDAEQQFQELQSQKSNTGESHQLGIQKEETGKVSSLVNEIANAREKIKSFLKTGDKQNPFDFSQILNRLQKLEKEKEETNEKLLAAVAKLDDLSLRIVKMESAMSRGEIFNDEPEKKKSVNGPADDDIDLFGSDEETEEEANLREERLKAYESKKAKKPALVAKSSVVLDVKPWDDETDMKALETAVRKIEQDGLKWGAGKLVPLAYGIKKLQIIAIVEDDKVSIDWLQETIEEIEDLVQSVDIAAFNKL